MNKLKAIVIDDESHARVLIMELIKNFVPEIEVCGEGKNLAEAKDLIHSLSPDLVFLDIEMPGYSGLQIKDHIKDEPDFEIIFVTAHNQYAIDALRLAAFDYLLKPVQLDELMAAVKRFLRLKRESKTEETAKKLAALEMNLTNSKQKKLILQTHQGVHYFDLDKILYLEASGMYSIIHTELKQFVASKPLKEFEENLGNSFFRIHRSYIVNMNNVLKYSGKDGGQVLLTNQNSLPVSRNRKEEFINRSKNGYQI